MLSAQTYSTPKRQTHRLAVQMDNWTWPDQIETREDYPFFENNQGTKIYIAPRRYIIHLTLNHQQNNIENNLEEEISSLKPVITRVHNYRYAPEPLKNLDSIFQLLGQNSGRDIYLYLTNISSQNVLTLAEKMQEYQELPELTIDGENTLEDGHIAYILDQDSVQRTVLELFYQEN